MKQKTGRYPGQPDWITKEFPMYRNERSGRVYWLLKFSELAHPWFLCNKEGDIVTYYSRERALERMTPIYKWHWSTPVVYWNYNWPEVSIKNMWHFHRTIVEGYNHVAVVPNHILEMDKPPTDIATWQKMLDNGELEVIK